MKSCFQIAIPIALSSLLLACSETPPPVDADGKTPDQVLLETYTMMVSGQCEEAMDKFSDAYLQKFLTDKNKSHEEYCVTTDGWQVSWLKAKNMGNDYNSELWRVKIIPDEGKGASNRPGVVHDLRIIDGQWKVVFWGDYPKS